MNWRILLNLQIASIFLSSAGWSEAQNGPPSQPPIPIPQPQEPSKYMEAIEAHLDYVTEHSYDQLGNLTTPMWLSAIDIRTNGLPDPLMPKTPRWDGILLSPAGANLYWDQPTILAAFELSKRSGCKCYSDSAIAYIKSFMTCHEDSTATVPLDPRFYYDVKLDTAFDSTATLPACKPYIPAWETVWSAAPALARRNLEKFTNTMITETSGKDFHTESGEHVSASRSATLPPPIDSEAELIVSLCWLAQKTPEKSEHFIATALAIARARMEHREEATGLVPTHFNHAVKGNHTSSLLLGAWATALTQATQLTGVAEFEEIAQHAMKAWLKFGFSESEQRFYPRIACKTGQPSTDTAPPTSSGSYSKPVTIRVSIFDHAQRPAHQSPIRMAEACLSLYEKAGDKLSRRAVKRWANLIKTEFVETGNQGAYAEDYGRAIHFLERASRVLDHPKYHQLATEIADEALKQLYSKKMGMFRSQPDQNRCDSADGPGLLLLALMYLEGSDPTQQSTLQF